MSDVKSIAVIGAGTMGSGIAYTAAVSGLDALVVDIVAEQLERARKYHAKTFARSVEKGRMTPEDADAAAARLGYHEAMADASAADWVVEAATENAPVKKKLFGQMLEVFREDVVLATNTSSISITDLASEIDDHAHRVVGMHFFNPVPVMKLVEVIRGLATSDETVERTLALARRLGKTPVPANDRPGFVSNRVLMPMINEAFYAWMEGVAAPEHVDEIMKLGCNFPMGPLRLADLIGLDVCHDILMVLHTELGQDKYFPCPKLRQRGGGAAREQIGARVYEYLPERAAR